jgi:uncharacterized protein YecE (DUF72 family)
VVRVDGRPARNDEDAANDLARLVHETAALTRRVDRVLVIFDHSSRNEAALQAVQFQESLEMSVGCP